MIQGFWKDYTGASMCVDEKVAQVEACSDSRADFKIRTKL